MANPPVAAKSFGMPIIFALPASFSGRDFAHFVSWLIRETKRLYFALLLYITFHYEKQAKKSAAAKPRYKD
jgi:hypothetical protein